MCTWGKREKVGWRVGEVGGDPDRLAEGDSGTEEAARVLLAPGAAAALQTPFSRCLISD